MRRAEYLPLHRHGTYYVEIGRRPRISKAATGLLLAWVEQRVAGVKVDDHAGRDGVMKYRDQARTRRRALVERAGGGIFLNRSG